MFRRRAQRARSRGVGLLGVVVAFARSPQGQQLIAEARRKYDTPANRAWLRRSVADLQRRFRRRGAA